MHSSDKLQAILAVCLTVIALAVVAGITAVNLPRPDAAPTTQHTEAK